MVAAVHLPRGMSRAGGDDDGEDEEGSEGQVTLLPPPTFPSFAKLVKRDVQVSSGQRGLTRPTFAPAAAADGA
jgi:hypothetical protein